MKQNESYFQFETLRLYSFLKINLFLGPLDSVYSSPENLVTRKESKTAKLDELADLDP